LVFAVDIDTIGKVVKVIIALVMITAIISATAPFWHQVKNRSNQTVDRAKKHLLSLVRQPKPTR
jgi:Na+-transporting NADH:ubiquinone oxidoreductase subunit NqrC